MKLIWGLMSLTILLTLAVQAEPLTQKPIYKVEVKELLINPYDLQCKASITSIINIHNRGNLDATVSVELVNSKLKVAEISPSIRIQAGRQQGIVVPFKIAKDVRGAYEFEIRLYTEEGIKRLFQTVHFQGCDKPKITSLIRDSKPLQQTQQEEEEKQSPPLPFHFLIGIGLLGVLALLSALFIIHSSLQKTQPET
jgi:hypothetical protein